jgi:hypothetical protein
MKVDLRELELSASMPLPPIQSDELLALIRVARAAMDVCEDTGDQYIDPSRVKKLRAALSDIEDSSNG